jgi:alpha-galactosidase
MEEQEHIQRHKELHKALDELLADMIAHTKMLPSTTTVLELVEWSYQQTIKPTEQEGK